MSTVSPLSIGLWSLGGGIASTYTLVYIGTDFGKTVFIVTLILSGLAATVGPQLGRLLRKSLSAKTLLGTYSTLMAVLLLGMTIGVTSPSTFVTCKVLYSLVSSMFISLMIGTRQIVLRGELFQHATTLSQGISATGSILGVWIALALDASSAPRFSLLCGAVCLSILTFYVLSVGKEDSQNNEGHP